MIILLARAVLAQLLVAGALLSSYVIATRLLNREPTLLRWTGVVVCGASLASVGFHILSTIEAFHPVGAVLSLTALMVAALYVGPGERRLHQWLRRDLRFVKKVRSAYHRSPYR